MLETNLWGCYHKRLTIVPKHLSSKDVEVIGWHGRLSYLEIDIQIVQFVIIRVLGIVNF